MGHQESYLYLKDGKEHEKAFSDVLDIFKKYNIRTSSDYGCNCLCSITLKQDVKAFHEISEKKDTFKAGTNFLYFGGERYLQRNIDTLFETSNIDYTDSEKKLISRFNIIPTENMPSEEIFKDKRFADIKKLNITKSSPLAKEVQEENKKEKSPKEIIKEQFQEGVRGVMESKKFLNWCKTAGKLYFNNYSFRNALLIYLQKPNSSYVMGYEGWKQFGRQVKKGETGIKIIIPRFENEGAKGSLLSGIKKNLKEQFNKNPSLSVASYRLGESNLVFNMLKNGLYEITNNNKVIQGLMTEEQLRKFIDTQVIGKIPLYYSVANVFDVESTTSEINYLWLKTGFKKDELALDANGNPQKNGKGEYKIINSEERKNSFTNKLDLSIPESDTEKMNTLYDVLASLSAKNGVPIKIANESDDKVLRSGAKGYFQRPLEDENGVIIVDPEKEYGEKGKIVISSSLSPTERVSVAFHEISHSVMHSSFNPEINRNMKEVQAEAVACITASNFGIDTQTSSFNYLAVWSGGREMKELESSLDLIYKQSKAFMKEIENELDSRGLTLELEPYIVKELRSESKKIELLKGVLSKLDEKRMEIIKQEKSQDRGTKSLDEWKNDISDVRKNKENSKETLLHSKDTKSSLDSERG